MISVCCIFDSLFWNDNNFIAAIEMKQRSASVSNIVHHTLKEIQTRRKQLIAENTISMLKQLRTSYQRPFLSVKQQILNEEETEEEMPLLLQKAKLIKEDFQQRCRKLCEELCFHLQVFQRLYKENYRKKSVIIRFYGWDKDFEEIFFYKHREELRGDINPEQLFLKFNFSSKTFETRNTYNKLRLFLSEIVSNNRKQQELQSKFMKMRLNSQLGKVDREIVDLAKDNHRKDVRAVLDEMGKTHNHMLNTKIKIHNKLDSLNKIEANTGHVKIKDYYGIEEKDIDDVEKYFTRLRLEKRH